MNVRTFKFVTTRGLWLRCWKAWRHNGQWYVSFLAHEPTEKILELPKRYSPLTVKTHPRWVSIARDIFALGQLLEISLEESELVVRRRRSSDPDCHLIAVRPHWRANRVVANIEIADGRCVVGQVNMLEGLLRIVKARGFNECIALDHRPLEFGELPIQDASGSASLTPGQWRALQAVH